MSVSSAPTQATPDLAPYHIETNWLRTPGAARRILVVYAHPDDESFGNAGMIARYAAEGADVYYACATRGECGGVAPEFLEGYADIAELRTAELNCAAQTLGMASVHFLGYRDSGMPGTPDNQNPAALVQAAQPQVIGQVVALMRALRPQVVLTFNPYGGYGHPDHIAIQRATVAAFAAAGDASQYPEQISDGLAAWSPSRLYYSTFGTRLLRLSILMARLRGIDPRRFGENGDIDMVRVADETTPITTAIDNGAYMAQKERAWYCHRSQIGGMAQLLSMPAPLRHMWMRREFFTRVAPAWVGGPREHDLFVGL